MADGTATVKKGRKFDQVLAGAREVFLRDGFEGAAVDEIAQVAQVSKATLYSYFPDKRLLFTEVVKSECERQAATALNHVDLGGDIAQIIEGIARQIVKFITSDFGQRIFRICVAESDRFPDLGRAFYESGPRMMRNQLSAVLASLTAKGDLVISDHDLAADQLAELCKADLFPRMVFNMAHHFDTAEVDRVIAGAVATFLARFGADPGFRRA